jgi:hypothetical protein
MTNRKAHKRLGAGEEIERTQASERMNALHGTTLQMTWHRDARRRSQTVSARVRHRTCSNEEFDAGDLRWSEADVVG